ncbi:MULTISPECIES: hypothetical protein [Burkholderia cepacia complex]|uniref:hypothetical protein n=1 Tax=Burkholderia cepacia complex TaxID=87882 RepID=UPI00114D1D16|nr:MULTISPECIES: hypothetical protein [Burkholderia cepacia complex]
MFSKKKPEGTEDQAHELMNLGGFGGLKRKSSPGTNKPEAPQPAQAQQKPSIPQRVLESLIAWAKENAEGKPNNEMILKTIQLVEQYKSDKDVLHVAEIIFDSFDNMLEEGDYDTDEFIADREKVKRFISTTKRQELGILTVSIANFYAANLIERFVGNNKSEDGKLFFAIVKNLAKEYAEVISR